MKSRAAEVGNALAAPFPVGVLAVAIFAWWTAKDAGYPPTTWYPGALFLLGLLLVAGFAYGRLTASGAVLVALCFLAGFAVWSGLSILWSSDRGIAWDGANRTALYLLVYALFAVVPWRRGSIPVLLCGFSLAVLVIGLIDLERAAGDPTQFFLRGRFAAPAGYPNAACAVYLLALWPVAYVAARREPPPLVRGVLLAAAAALGELGLLAQSRGSLIAVPMAVVAYLVVVPARLRAACGLLVVALAVFAARSPLLDVFDPLRNGADPRGPIHRALIAIAISAAAVFAAWTLVGILDRHVDLSPGALRIANSSALALAALALGVGAVAIATANPGPRERLDNAWHNFKAGYPEQTGSSHFALGLGSNRYDFFRVAVIEFRHHPVAGVGVDNFAADYVRYRRSGEEPLYPHSLEFRVLAQTGLVGAVLFGGFLIAAAVAVAWGVGGEGGLAAGAARAGVAAALYVAIHGSADWFWEFPALTAPALAWLGLAASRSTTASPRRRRRLAVPLGLSIGAVALAASMIFPWLAALDAQRALRGWERTPQQAFSDLGRSRELNPLSNRADVLAGVIAGRLDEVPRMRLAFRRAVERDDRQWYPHFELALAEAALGDRASALAELDVARRLNPREEAIALVRHRIAAGRPVDRRQIDQLFAARVRARIGP